MAVVGCVLLNNRTLTQVIPILGGGSEMFYIEEAGRLYATASGLYQDGKPADPVTLAGRLGANFDAAFYAQCTGAVPTSANAEHYAGLVRDAWAARELITAGLKLGTGLYDGWQDWRGLLSEHVARAESVAQQGQHAGSYRADAVWQRVFERLTKIAHGQQPAGQVKTGFSGLDDLLVGGLLPGELCVIAARTGIGKTAVALNVCEAAARAKVSTCFVSLEMDVDAIVERLMGILAGADIKRIRTGWNAESELDKIRGVDKGIIEYITFEESRSSRLLDVVSLLRQHHEKHGPGLLIVDYLQLITTHERDRRGRHEIVAEATRTLKQLARQTNSPVVLLAQLNRAAEKETDPYRLLSYLRESGAIEQDADSVCFLTVPPDNVRQNLATETGINAGELVLLTLAKNRRGTIGRSILAFRRELQRLTEPNRYATQQPAPATKPSAYFGGVTGEKYEEDEDEFAF